MEAVDSTSLSASSNNAWRKVERGIEPIARYGHSSEALVAGEMGVVCIGGSAVDGSFLGDVAVFDLQALQWRSPYKLPAEFGPGRNFAVSCVWQQRVYVFGGKANGYNNEVLCSRDGAAFEKLRVTGTTPTGRYGHAAARVGGQWFVYGGYDTSAMMCSDMYRLDLERAVWEKIDSVTPAKCRPEARMHHTLVAWDGKLWVFGGKLEGGKAANDVWAYDIATREWREVSPSKRKGAAWPEARWGHSATMVATQSRPSFVVFGGCAKDKEFGDVWAFEPKTEQWERWPLDGAQPEPRYFHTATLVGATIHVFGGRDLRNIAFSSMFKFEVHRCWIDMLPRDVMLYILSFLPPEDLLHVARVAKRFNTFASSDRLWKPFLDNFDHYWGGGGLKWHVFFLEKDASLPDTGSIKDQVREKVMSQVRFQSLPQGNYWNHEVLSAIEAKRREKGLQSVKLVMSGDGATGKTCFLIRATTNAFPHEYVPTVFDNYHTLVHIGARTVGLSLWDTNGGEDYDRLRPLSYPQTDVFVVNFSCVSPTSFANVTSKWVPELRHHCPEVPLILHATKSDLRNDPATLARMSERGIKPVSHEEAIELAKRLQFYAYVESSSLTGEGCGKVIATAIEAATSKGRNPKFVVAERKCVLC